MPPDEDMATQGLCCNHHECREKESGSKTHRALNSFKKTLVLLWCCHAFIHIIYICMSKSDAEFNLPLSVHSRHSRTPMDADWDAYRPLTRRLLQSFTVDVIHCAPRLIFPFLWKYGASLHIWFDSHGRFFSWMKTALHVCMLTGKNTCLSYGDSMNTVQTPQ